MISTLVYEQCERILVLVPSAILRKQMLDKFSSLGCLREIGVVDQKTANPRVAIIESGIKKVDDVAKLVDNSNVIIALSQALKNFSAEAKQELITKCSHLFIDEAHHVPAQTWNEIKDSFKDKPIVQFTATPFRRDGKRIDFFCYCIIKMVCFVCCIVRF
jgi:superfamily II DNA or RNA helicase